MSVAALPSLYSSWFRYWKEDLQPSPGRIDSTLRSVLATVLVLVAMMTLRVPFIAYGLYVIFVVSNENPAVTLRAGIVSLLVVSFALGITLIVVIVTDNDPMARIVGLAVMTFLGAMIMVATSLPAMGPIWGLISAVAFGLWESHAPSDTIVKNCLWLLAAFSSGIAGAVAIGYIFASRSPADQLGAELRTRYRALAAMFDAYAEDAAEALRFGTAEQVSRLAAVGHRGMLDLYNQVVNRNLETGDLPIGLQVHILIVSEVLDNAAAFGLQAIVLDSELRNRCRRVAQRCVQLANEFRRNHRSSAPAASPIGQTALDRVESLLALVENPPPPNKVHRALVGLPAKQVALLIPGAICKVENVAFALKISLCATICYVLYRAIDWPGISTAVITVVVAGLTNSGSMKQRLTFRLFGTLLGGLVLGIGADVFLFPFMDSITSLSVLIGGIAFLCAWVASGRRFGYVGLQIAFTFYLTSLGGFAAPTELAPARDRFVGILLAMVVMWLVFDQIWPVRATTEMRNVVASVLTDASRVIGIVDTGLSVEDSLRESDRLRDRLGKQLSIVRTLNDATDYEFGADRDKHVRAGKILMQLSMTAVALVWSHTMLINRQERRETVDDRLVKLRQSLAQGLSLMAESLPQKGELSAPDDVGLPTIEQIEATEADYVKDTVARYSELKALAVTFNEVGIA